MQQTLTINQIIHPHLTKHGYERMKQRNIIPHWCSKRLAQSFINGHIKHAGKVEKQGNLTKVINPAMKIYVRDRAIVTVASVVN